MSKTAAPARDMTTPQYITALKKHGFTNAHLGYLYCPPPLNHIQIFAENGGKRLRDRLAYVLREWRRLESRQDVD